MKIDIRKGKARRVSNNLARFFTLQLLSDKVWLAGGALRAALNSEHISDYDLFFANSYEAARVEVELEALKAEVVFKCPQGKLTTMKLDGMKIQLITEFWYNDMDELIDSFDITACRFASDGKAMVTRYSSIRDAYNLEINLHKIDFPVATMKRIAKYVEKGYKLTTKAAIKFVETVRAAETLDDRVYID